MALAAAALLAAPGVAWAADTTIGFETPGAETTITDQYANTGGTGQGVVFGPLPGNVDDGVRPILKAPAAQDHGTSSGSQAADISYVAGCEGCVPRTTATFNVPRSRVSVHVGYPGTSAGTCSPGENAAHCVVVTLTAYNAQGGVITSSAPATLTEGGGMATVLNVQSASSNIAGIRIAARETEDHYKVVYIDDLVFDIPETPPPPDFTLTPETAKPAMLPGQTVTDQIAIGRLAGSSGDVGLTLTGTLPPGVHASLAPNPANGTTATLTLSADPDAPPTDQPVTLTVTGTPSSASAGSAPRSANVTLTVLRAFGIARSGSDSVDVAGCNVRIPFLVSRDFAFAGPVDLTVTGAPPGVTATMDPPQAAFAGGVKAERVEVEVVAPATGQPIDPAQLTVHATAGTLPERTASVSIHGACPAQYDAQITSIQITQGTQSRFLPGRDGVHQAVARYADIPGAAMLRRDAPTIVRAYADNNWGPSEGVARVPVVLAGFYYDRTGIAHQLPGSPLLPNNGPRTLQNGGLTVSEAEMEADDGAYTFTLPPLWTHYNLGISAQLWPALPPPDPAFAQSRQAGARSVAPCATEACKLNDTFGLTQIPFYGTTGSDLYPLDMTNGGVHNPDPQDVFKWAKLVTPVPVRVLPYQATIDITDIATSGASDDDRNQAVFDRVGDWACDNDRQAVGVNTYAARGKASTGGWCWNLLGSVGRAIVEYKRPLTSVAHEWFHLLGRLHASPGCGGGSNGHKAESWPPDQMGYLQSVGINTILGSGANGAPYDVVPNNTRQWYDLMSYCADGGTIPDPVNKALVLNSWVSVRNWNAILSERAFKARGRPRRAVRAAGPQVPSLVISGAAFADGNVSVVSVTPRPAPAQHASDSPYHLVASDAAGATLADVAMVETSEHVDGAPSVTGLYAVVPAAGVARVAIVRNGTVLAMRDRSAHAPTVSPLRVQPGTSTATVAWNAADADGDKLVVSIDYSGDGGRTWHQVYVGPNRGKASFPARYLFRASRGRVRVNVRDGFDQTTSTSPVFRAHGARPVVRITSPGDGVRQPNDATLLLSGQAFDDRGRAITGRRLRWLAGRRLLGTGAEISVAGLPATTRRIVLEARDRAGRIGRDVVRVHLAAARPLLLKVSAPQRAARTQRSLRIRVASSIAARLVVRGAGVRTQRFAVSRSPRSLRIAIPRGRKPLVLRLALRGGDRRTVRVART